MLLPVTAFGQVFNLQTGELGINNIRRTNGAAVADYDRDGDLDIYIVAAFRFDPEDETTLNRLYANHNYQSFVDVTEESGLSALVEGVVVGNTQGHKFGPAWGDYNNDGWPDLYLANAGPNQLFHNNGDGTFTDVTEAAGVQGNDTTYHTSAMWWDFDRDGDLDLHLADWVYENVMYENLGDGTFQDITEAVGLDDPGHTFTSLPIDVNSDRRPDIYNVNDHGANRLYINKGNDTFREVTAAFGLQDFGHGMGADIGDYNNDGLFDIYLTNIADLFLNPLFMNTGQNYFINQAEELGVGDTGWGWGTAFFDCDHDGDLDLYATNGSLVDPGRNHFFFNTLVETGSPGFQDISEASGTDGIKEARGLVIFDYDDDGDLDMLVSNRDNTPDLYHNHSVTANWLKVDLQGVVSNYNGVGAILRLTADGNTYHRLNDGSDFLGHSIQPVHFGIGDAAMAEELQIRWPNGLVETITNIPANQTINIREGQGIITGIQDAVSDAAVPEEFAVFGNYPNPFNGVTNIKFSLPEPGELKLRIFDTLGQRVATFQKQYTAPGTYELNWNTTDDAGQAVGSGVYIYQVVYEGSVITGKMLYLK